MRGSLEKKKKKKQNKTKPKNMAFEDSLLSSSERTPCSTSSFLKLPPEIRNEVYRLILCGNDIHVDSIDREGAGPEFWHRICTAPVRDHDVAKQVKDKARAQRCSGRLSSVLSSPRYIVRHCRCLDISRGGECLTLDILLVCKQIYSEAALAPYWGNKFLFGDPRGMKTFLEVLNCRQAAAIEHIVLAHPGFEYDSRLARTFQCRLKSLRTLVCFRHVFRNERGEISFDLETRAREARSLQAFKAVPSRDVALIVLFRSGLPSRIPSDVSSESLRSVLWWVSSIEHDLNQSLLSDFSDTSEAESSVPERRLEY